MKITFVVVALVLGMGEVMAQAPAPGQTQPASAPAPQVQIKSSPLPEDALYWKLRSIDHEIVVIQQQFADLVRQREEALKAACVQAGAVDEKKQAVVGCNVSWQEKLVRWPVQEKVQESNGGKP